MELFNVILLYAQGTDAQVELVNAQPNKFGSIMTPRNSKRYLGRCAGIIGVDNDCFTGFNEPLFIRTLKTACEYRDRVRFVSAPDVVADAETTLERFETWQPIITRDYKLPVALVLQDRMTPASVAWDLIDAVFVGGSTEWKLSSHARELIYHAQRRGKWVHAGRCSTKKRINYFRSLGINSIDSTAFSRWPRHVESFQQWTKQGLLFSGEVT